MLRASVSAICAVTSALRERYADVNVVDRRRGLPCVSPREARQAGQIPVPRPVATLTTNVTASTRVSRVTTRSGEG